MRAWSLGNMERKPWRSDRKGAANGRSKLTDDDVTAIRSEYPGALQRELAIRFGVHQTCISQIISRKRWTHL